MAAGCYRLDWDTGRVHERFRCGAGPAGWRYASVVTSPEGAALGAVDLVLDRSGRAVRMSVSAGGWLVRGGVVGAQALWRRTPDPSAPGRRRAGALPDTEAGAAAGGFAGSSPAFLLAAAWLAGPRGGRLRLVELTEPVLAPRTVDRLWSPAATEVRDGVTVTTHRVSDLSTGEQALVHLAGDLVLSAPGTVLAEVEGHD